jgi:hypothetical protein
MEILSRMLNKDPEGSYISLVLRFGGGSREVVVISHFFFAYNTILFYDANAEYLIGISLFY